MRMYTVSLEYSEYSVTQWAPLPNLLGPDGIPNTNLAHPFSMVLPQQRNDSSCGLNITMLPYKYGNKHSTLRTLPSFVMATHSPLGFSVSCILTIMGCCHN